jgi:hypothetical protein
LVQDYEVALSEANKAGAGFVLSGVPTEAIAVDPRTVGGVMDASAPRNLGISTPNR